MFEDFVEHVQESLFLFLMLFLPFGIFVVVGLILIKNLRGTQDERQR